MVAALSTGMLANASHDQGDLQTVMTLGRTAYLAAQNAGQGGAASACDALARAEAAREGMAVSDLDEIGGQLTFPVAQQIYYRAETLVLADPNDPAALAAADAAAEAYSDATATHWAFGGEAGSRAHQAMTRITGRDLDAGLAALEPVLTLAAGQRTHGITVCARRTLDVLPPLGPSAPRRAAELRDAVEEFGRTPSRRSARVDPCPTPSPWPQRV